MITSKARLARVPVVLAAAVSLSLSGCGGSKGESASSWVGTYCGAGQSVRQQLTSSNESLSATLSSGAGPSDLKETIVVGAQSDVDVSAKQLARIKDNGSPAVDDGDAIQAAVLAKFTQIDGRVKALQTAAKALPTDNVNTFTAALKPYSQELSDASHDLGASFGELSQYKGYEKLDAASKKKDDFGTADTCTKFRTVN